MRLSATDKAIAELLARKADIDRAEAFVLKYGEHVAKGIEDERGLMDRCIEMLRSVGTPATPKAPKAAPKPRRKKTNGAVEADA